MPSLRAKVLKSAIRKFFNFNPEIIEKNGKDIIKVVRSMEIGVGEYKAPCGYTLEQYNLDGSSGYLFYKTDAKSDKVLYVLHGGAYIGRLGNFYKAKNKRYCNATGANVFQIDYRAAPENIYPSALEDALLGWDLLLSQGYKEENIIVLGDSAGGHLAVSLIMKLLEQNRTLPKAAILFSPWLDMTGSGASYIDNYFTDPMFGIKKKKGTSLPSKERIDELLKCDLYSFAGSNDRKNPYISPIFADAAGFCPTLIIAGGDEMPMSDSVTFADKLKEAGVETTLEITPFMFHVFPLFEKVAPECKKAFQLALNYINAKFKA